MSSRAASSLRRVSFRRLTLLLGVVALASPAGSRAVAQTPPALYEATTRFVILHQEVDPTAAPVPVEVAAAVHAAQLKSPSVLQAAVAAGKLNALPSLAQVPAPEVAAAIGGGILVYGRPSADFVNVTVVELRYRAPSADDATAVVRAVTGTYVARLNETDPAIQDKLKAAAAARDEPAKEDDEQPDFEAKFRAADNELNRLRLRARVKRFAVHVIDEPTAVAITAD